MALSIKDSAPDRRRNGDGLHTTRPLRIRKRVRQQAKRDMPARTRVACHLAAGAKPEARNVLHAKTSFSSDWELENRMPHTEPRRKLGTHYLTKETGRQTTTNKTFCEEQANHVEKQIEKHMRTPPQHA